MIALIWLNLGDNAVLDAEPFPNREALGPVVLLDTLHFSLCPEFQSDVWHFAELVNRENKGNEFKNRCSKASQILKLSDKARLFCTNIDNLEDDL